MSAARTQSGTGDDDWTDENVDWGLDDSAALAGTDDSTVIRLVLPPLFFLVLFPVSYPP